MESLLIVGWYLVVLVAGELTIWKLQSPRRNRLVGWMLPFMLLGHPLWWLFVGLGGAANLFQRAAGHGGADPLLAAVCAFTGLSLVPYMAFRFMPRADQLLRI